MVWAGIATGARVVPMVVLGPVGGVLADRFDRRRVMVACDLLRLALMVALAVVAAARLPVALVPVLAALATTAGTPYLACVSATTPRLVRDADLPGANAARSAVTALGVMVGPALGGVLLLIGPAALAFGANAATFGVAALCVLAIRDRSVFAVPPASSAPAAATSGPVTSGPVTSGPVTSGPVTSGPVTSGPVTSGPVTSGPAILRSALGSVSSGIADGAAALRAHPAAIRLVGRRWMCSFVYGMQTVVFVLVARQAGLGLHGYGYLFAALGVGALAGTSLAGRALKLPYRTGAAIAMGLVGLSMIVMPAARLGAVAILLACVNGAGSILVEVMTETGLQRTLPEEIFGRAYGAGDPRHHRGHRGRLAGRPSTGQRPRPGRCTHHLRQPRARLRPPPHRASATRPSPCRHTSRAGCPSLIPPGRSRRRRSRASGVPLRTWSACPGAVSHLPLGRQPTVSPGKLWVP